MEEFVTQFLDTAIGLLALKVSASGTGATSDSIVRCSTRRSRFSFRRRSSASAAHSDRG
jgi:hypothetical protein